MVGSAILRCLADSDHELITADRDKLDLTDQKLTAEYLSDLQPDQVYLAAAKVGGIKANNDYPADFISENLLIQLNTIRGSTPCERPKASSFRLQLHLSKIC